MTVEDFCKKFWVISPGIPAINEGEVPILLSNGKAYVPGPDNHCTEFPNEEAVIAKYPGGAYVIVSN